MKQVRQRDGSPSKCHPDFSLWLSTIFPKNRFALVLIMLERAACEGVATASIPITFAQIMIVQRMIKNSAATFLEIYT
jgi:hypothetical protein